MSIAEYFEEKKEYENALDIVSTSRRVGNNSMMHYAKRSDIYHIVAFSFSNKRNGGCSHSYDSSDSLAEYIGKACEEMKSQIFDRALELFKENLVKTANSAEAEALEVLNATTLEGFLDENKG